MALYLQLCIRHVPCKILESEFLDLIRGQGLDVAHYRVYFPKRPGRQGRRNNVGYGFVTCQREADAEAFARTFQGFHFDHVQSTKRLLVELAYVKEDEVEMQRVMARSLTRSLPQAEMVSLSHSQGQVSEGNEHVNVLFERSTGNFNHGSMVPDPSDVPPTRLSCFINRS
eukprot:TRINITY_DN7507_c0_g1_i1.p1 TRINITY_DN7507_c0_g1~~TRINITY_DN7507_c0_g1_i1.p1  ORF type:complete len:184 (+),score=9.33 TRINITY_DN7507_c0_g1_i1:43-552(+)